MKKTLISNNQQPLVTVLMSVYNGDKYLSEAIDSILNQTYSHFEFLIIDDASTDNTSGILDSYAKQDNRVLVIKNRTNIGLTKSLNLGIKEAKGKYIARMDADDISLADRLEKQVVFLEEHLGVVLCGTLIDTANALSKHNKKCDTFISSSEIKAILFFHNAIAHPTFMFRKKEILNSRIIYNEEYIYTQDYEFLCKLSEKFNMACLREKLLVYRHHEKNISVKNSVRQKENAFFIALSNVEALLHRKLTPNEKILHRILTGNFLGKIKYKISEISDWCIYLNKTNNKFEKTFFIKTMGDCWLNALRCIENVPISIFWEYFKFPFRKEMNLGLRDLFYLYRHQND